MKVQGNMAKTLPNRADLVDYNHAVAGHDGTMCDVNGELFIKPCTQAEISFYQTSIADHPDFAEYMPAFLGTLQLSDQQNQTIEEQAAALLEKHNNPDVVVSAPTKVGKRITTDTALVLENASHGFVRPNILDVKLGVRLWADDAHQDKKTRFDLVTKETTHKELGFRIAGMRVWQGEGATGPDIDEEGYRIFNKDYGRYKINTTNIHDAFRAFIFSTSAGIDEELGSLVAQAFLADVYSIQKTLEGQESRMYSASLLFVFEGDGVALRKAMEEASESPAEGTDHHEGEFFSEHEVHLQDQDHLQVGSQPRDGVQAHTGISPEALDGTMSPKTLGNGVLIEALSTVATLDGVSLESLENAIPLQEYEGKEEEEEDDDEDEIPEPKIYSIKIIDFAHAEWTPGLGPDENALTGIRSVVRILEDLAKA